MELKQIEQVVSKAFDKLSPTLVEAVTKNGYFITNVVSDELPIKVNGIYRPPPEMVIIDCQKEMTFDPKDFVEHSMRLYGMFRSVERWYKC